MEPGSPPSVLMAHAHVHEGVADETVAVGRVVTEDLAQHGVVDATGWGILNKIHHKVWIPTQVGICRNHIIIYGLLYFWTGTTEVTRRRVKRQNYNNYKVTSFKDRLNGRCKVFLKKAHVMGSWFQLPNNQHWTQCLECSSSINSY